MGRLRERPRLAAARVAGVVLLLATGVAIGVLADDRGSDAPAQAKTELQRAKLLGAQRAARLDRTGAEIQDLRAGLQESAKRTKNLARENAVLRQHLRSATRALRRAERTRRARSR